MSLFDGRLGPIWEQNPNMLVPYYLIHSYLYYEKDEPIITDVEYDLICKTLEEKWDQVKHRHKKLINKSSLNAGTGYYIKKYPEIVKGAAESLKKEMNK